VIPSDWTAVHRADGELVGYLAPDGAPRLLTGAHLPPTDRDPRDLLVSRGLAALDRRWWCRLPTPLVDGTDAGRPGDDWTWSAVVIVEASPAGCRVRLEWAEPAELRAQALLPVPVGELLREEPPA
jgi:hypothetical protein